MAPKKSPKKDASPPKKTRQSPNKARAAALEAEAAAAEPSQRVTRTSPAKRTQSPAPKPTRKTESPSKVTKAKSPVKSPVKANASPAKAKDERFRGPPSESSRGYKADESIQDIVKAIDGRRLTALDKFIVAAIRDLGEGGVTKKKDRLRLITARHVVAKTEEPYAQGEEPIEKVHFNIYWHFRKHFEKIYGEWPSLGDEDESDQSSTLETEDTDDDVSDDDAVDDDAEVISSGRGASGARRARDLSATTLASGKSPSASRVEDLRTQLKIKRTCLKKIEAAVFQKVLQRGRYIPEDLPSYEDCPKEAKISRQDFEKVFNKGVVRALKALDKSDSAKLEKAMRKDASNSGQTQIPRTNEGGIVISQTTPRLQPKKPLSTPKAPKPVGPIMKPTPSPSKPADPRQAEKERKQREAKRIADVRARKAIVEAKQAYPPTEENTLLPYASRRGNILSSTNPPTISIAIKKADGTEEIQERVNPFFETLPGPEVWHRNMPPFFSFGDTKLMEQIISDQINADLARTHDIVPTKAKEAAADKSGGGFLAKGKSLLFGSAGPKTPVEETQPADDSVVKPIATLRKDQWALPELTPQDEKTIRDQLNKTPQGTKRTSATSQESSRKRR
ncbi:hypothetical protein Slin14017_G018570 [Septoria linicola]|nr:hypothetical protein Slin14017_G018570 [Septoria linicola]